MNNDCGKMEQDDTVKLLCEYFLKLIKNNSDREDLPDELMKHQNVVEICQQLRDMREFGLSLKDGRLDYTSSSRGYLLSIFKALQSELKHITWQMQNVANGEYTHKILFLGEFSDSFNSMISHIEDAMEEIKTIAEKYKKLSLRDPLTLCHNRNSLEEVSQSLLQRVARGKQNTILLMLDLDFFKNVNDTYGHIVGDAVLCEFVKYIYESLRFEDICCRYGGEEFLIIVPGVTLEIGKNIAERIREKVEDNPIIYDGKTIFITVSIGVAGIYHEDVLYDTKSALSQAIEKADANLYIAKRNGRNQVWF